jgi:hypothetical protein
MPEIRVQLPGSGVVATYISGPERNRSLRLAEARQMIAHEGGPHLPAWPELTDREREMSALEARNWLRAAVRAGLIKEDDRG